MTPLTAVAIPAIAFTIGLGTAKANAQTFNFSGTYNTVVELTELANLPEEEQRQRLGLAEGPLPLLREVLPSGFEEGLSQGVLNNLPQEVRDGLPEDLLTPIPSFLLNSPARFSEVVVTGTLAASDSEEVFGLTEFRSETYGLGIPLAFFPDENPNDAIPPAPSVLLSIFRGDPAAFGLTNAPIRTDRYFGTGTDNELFGIAADQAVFDFNNGRVGGFGTITVTGGDGLFENATGTIDFSQNDRLGPAVLGQATLDYSIQVLETETVPEPGTNTALIGLGLIGAGLLLRRRRQPRF